MVLIASRLTGRWPRDGERHEVQPEFADVAVGLADVQVASLAGGNRGRVGEVGVVHGERLAALHRCDCNRGKRRERRRKY